MKKYFTLLLTAFLIAGAARAQSFLDPSFGTGGVVITPSSAASLSSGNFAAVIMQPDQKIVAAGGGDGFVTVVRYKENGTPDSAFAVNGIFMGGPAYCSANALALQPDGKIVIEGVANTGSKEDFLTMRLNTDGSLDNTFGLGGIVLTGFSAGSDYGYALALQPDGKILITGDADDTYVSIARLLSNGAPDSTFGTNGLITTTYPGGAYAIAVMPDGRIVISGASYTNQFMAMRLQPDGTADMSFNATGMVTTLAGNSDDYCDAMQLQPDGKIVLAGFGLFGRGIDFALIRYNTDGTLDRSFGDTGVVDIDFNGHDDETMALQLTPDGKFMAAGFSIVTYAENFALARINSNGSIDSTFGINGRITTPIQDSNARALGVTAQTDGKIILAGYSVDAVYMEQMTVARYLDGSVSVNNVASTNDAPVLYPNPSHGNLNIKGNLSHIADVTAYDVQGNQIPINSKLPDPEILINDVADGIYFFCISFDNRSPVTQKIIIQNN